MAKYVYPAVFTKEDCGYAVNFPDVPSCYTSGQTMAEAIEMAEDVLSITMCDREDENLETPKASEIDEIKHEKNEVISLIACDTLEYRKLYNNKAVKKTLTIPTWLNTIAEKNQVNFSSILQKALVEQLHLD